MQTEAGLLLAVMAWLVPRRISGARWSRSGALLLDCALPAAFWTLLAAATARPIVAGCLTLTLCACFAAADRAKRNTLGEPVVFTDVFQALDILRHPSLALPFPYPKILLSGAILTMPGFAFLFQVEHPAWPWTAWPALLLLTVYSTASWVFTGPLLHRFAGMLAKLGASGEPAEDGVRLGPFATLLVYGIEARSRRPALRSAANHLAATTTVASDTAAPVVVVQCESFFDARRLHPALQLSLPALDRYRRQAAQWGRLGVPTVGANTSRTEFAVLSGLPQQALGHDRFNPYHRFARAPVRSLAWRLRGEGYHCICVHPFDPTFYGRNRVMPELGFHQLIGAEAFTDGDRAGRFISDLAVARVAAQLLRRHGPRLFLFLVTMENHGPWPEQFGQAVEFGLPELPVGARDRASLGTFLRGLQDSDAMLGVLGDELANHHQDAVLAFYGDHLPGLRTTFKKLQLDDYRSDYVIWRTDSGRAPQIDLPADALHDAILASRRR